VTLKTPLWMQAGGGDAVIEFSGLDYRAVFDAMIQAEGYIGPTSLKVVQRGAGANFSVDVLAGFEVIQGDDTALQGKYLCENTATYNVPLPSPPVSGSRIHRIIARIKDKLHNGSDWSTYEWTISYLEDTGSGTPALPASAITLALVTIASGASNVTDANINQQRQTALMWPTRPHLAASTADYPPNPRVGERVHRSDISPIEFVYDGSAWRMDGSAARIYKDRSADATGRTATVLSADDQLTVTLLAGVTYRGTLVLPYTADAAGDFKWKLVPPAGGTINGSAMSLPAAATGASGNVTLDQYTEASSPIGGGSGATQMTVTVQVKMWSGSGGTCAVHWCRDGGTGTTTLLAGAFMDLTPVGL
jgi:hypothetical protein